MILYPKKRTSRIQLEVTRNEYASQLKAALEFLLWIPDEGTDTPWYFQLQAYLGNLACIRHAREQVSALQVYQQQL